MKQIFVTEKIPIIIIFSVFVLTFILTYGSWGNLLIDCGREAYVPYAIINNKLLYKDIFTIYGPFPYLFIAFFYKILFFNLNIIYFLGAIFAMFYLFAVYLIAREFLSALLSTSICLLIIFAVIFDASVFNFILPYSFAMVFASTFSIWILYFLIKYIETKKTTYFLYSCVLWGAIFVSKIDFIPTGLLIPFVFCACVPNKKQMLPKCLYCLLSIPFLTYLILFTQGISLHDIWVNSHYIKQMVNTPSFHYFYKSSSVLFFNSAIFFTNIKNLFYTVFISLIYFVVFLFAIRRRKSFFKYFLLIFISIFCLYIFFFQKTYLQIFFVLLPYFCTIMLVFYLIKFYRAKEYYNTANLNVILLFSFAILGSLKVYHCLSLSHYGAFSFAPVFICLVYYICEFLKNNALYNTKKQYEIVLCVYISIFIILFVFNVFINLIVKDDFIISPRGKIRVNHTVAQPFNDAFKYLNVNSKSDDTIIVLPEGIIFNFLLGRLSDFYQTSFIPLDFETFKEDNIIKDINIKKPDFVIFTNAKKSEYGQNFICKDYGIDTCRYVVKNYSLEAAFGEKFRIYIFKRKDKDMNYEKE